MSGQERDEVRPWLAVAAVAVVVVFVNATSGMIEGEGKHWSEPLFCEVTSGLAVVALAPLIGYAIGRWPPRADALPAFALLHLGLTVPFSLAHVALIFIVREAGYAAFGGRYGFFDDGVAMTLLYEWRKDVLVYGAIAATYWMFRRFQERAPMAPAGQERIEVRDGGAVAFVNAGDISHIEAAGNYVEIHTAAKTHLVRGTLASWEARLGARGFVRVHRSRLVNRSKVAALKPTASGDVEIALCDGRTLLGSRRYRARYLAAD
jgi:hypothetical protein